MKTQLFTTLYVRSLTIDDLFSINKSTIDYAVPIKELIGDLPKATLTQLETDNAAMGTQMNKARKNVLTPQIIESDKDRDDRYSEVKRNVTTAVKGRDAEKKSAGDNLKIFLDPYWETNKKAMNTQTGVFDELFTKYNANETLKAQAATIGIDAMMTGLELANNNFNALYQTRNDQDAAQDGPSASSLKTASAKSYEQFCFSVEQAVNFMPNETLTTLFKQMNELRKKYAKLVPKKDKETEESMVEAE